MRQIKTLKEKGNKFNVQTNHIEDKGLAKYLIDKLSEPLDNNVQTEWLFSYESPLVKPLVGKGFSQLVYGCCVQEQGYIEIYLDNILKAYNINGFEPVETWFSLESSKHLIHELIHYLAPEWTEEQVEKATEKVMEAWVSKASRLVVHIGNKTFTHLLSENNQVLEVETDGFSRFC
jgi:hypothetical protein